MVWRDVAWHGFPRPVYWIPAVTIQWLVVYVACVACFASLSVNMKKRRKVAAFKIRSCTLAL